VFAQAKISMKRPLERYIYGIKKKPIPGEGTRSKVNGLYEELADAKGNGPYLVKMVCDDV
jgi:hypothetical protein